jgi:hypothetical protein
LTDKNVFDQAARILESTDGSGAKSDVNRRQRVAAVALTFLMERCAATLTTYVADSPLRGVMPFPRWVISSVVKEPILMDSDNREREEELVYVLDKIAWLELEEGTLRAADTDDPTQWLEREAAGEATRVPEPASSRDRVAEELARTSGAHLLRLYPLLISLVALPLGRRRTVVRREPDRSSRPGKQEEGEEGNEPNRELWVSELARWCLVRVGESVVV